MKYGNIFMCSVPSFLNVNRGKIVRVMKKYSLPDDLLPRETSATDAFRAATNDLQQILHKSNSPYLLQKEPNKGDMLIRSVRLKRRRGKAKALAKIWFCNDKIQTKLSPAAERLEQNPTGVLVQFKACYNDRRNNITKRQLKTMITNYLFGYAKAVPFMGSAWFIPAPETSQLSLLQKMLAELSSFIPGLSSWSLDVTSPLGKVERETLTQTCCNGLKQEVWEAREDLLYMLETRSSSVPVITRKCTRAEQILDKLYTYRPICGPAFVLKQESLLLEPLSSLKKQFQQAA